jgi:hypothetical protein
MLRFRAFRNALQLDFYLKDVDGNSGSWLGSGQFEKLGQRERIDNSRDTERRLLSFRNS